MSERYPGYLFGGTPVSSWDRSFNTLENQIQHQYRGRSGPGRYWGSMSEGGGVSSAGGDNARTNLIVNYLPQSMTEKDLYAMFMTIGPIESCRVMKDFKTGYSYGFGFVNFTREEDASRAIDTFNGYQLRNKRLKVSYARPSGEDIKETNLYVTNLPRAVNEDQLETIFGKYGRIVQKHILRDKNNGSPRGVAFVRFDKREEAQEAIAALNNVIPEGGTEALCVKVAEEHGKQKAAYYAGWAAGFHHNRGPNDCPPEFNSDSEDFGPMPAMPLMSLIPPMPPPVGQKQGPRHRRNNKMMGGDYAWSGCGGCMTPDPWDQFTTSPLGGSLPPTPRNGCRPGMCASPRAPYPNYAHKGGARPNRGRNLPWAGGYAEDKFKGQRCRNGPSPYW